MRQRARVCACVCARDSWKSPHTREFEGSGGKGLARSRVSHLAHIYIYTPQQFPFEPHPSTVRHPQTWPVIAAQTFWAGVGSPAEEGLADLGDDGSPAETVAVMVAGSGVGIAANSSVDSEAVATCEGC